MKKLIYFCFLFSCIHGFAQMPDADIRYLKEGRLLNDTSFIYSLPYKEGIKYLFVQGANSNMSHKDELSFDFKMKRYSVICSARDGVVIATKSDSKIGGMSDEFLDDGNYIMIRHSDGSVANYWHLDYNGVLVQVGDTVTMGKPIGYSGNTGYSAFPHLHFQLVDANHRQILPRFRTSKGVMYLRPGKWYKRIHE